jgi:hypothetical protein
MFTAMIIAPDFQFWPSVDEDPQPCDKVRFVGAVIAPA